MRGMTEGVYQQAELANGPVTACSKATIFFLLQEGVIDVLLSLHACKLHVSDSWPNLSGGLFHSSVLLPSGTQPSLCPPWKAAQFQWLAVGGDVRWCCGIASVHTSTGCDMILITGLDGSGRFSGCRGSHCRRHWKVTVLPVCSRHSP